MAEQREPVEVVRLPAEERFEIRTGGEPAYLSYAEMDGRLYLMHTEVPEAFGGRGLGGELLRAALEHARGAGMQVVAFCPYAKVWLGRHPEYAELVAE